jgi:hypothetical protein
MNMQHPRCASDATKFPVRALQEHLLKEEDIGADNIEELNEELVDAHARRLEQQQQHCINVLGHHILPPAATATSSSDPMATD